MNTNDMTTPNLPIQEPNVDAIEFLKLKEGFEDDLECICGPDVMQDSFWPCDKDGQLIDPAIPTKDLYTLCKYCGRIIDVHSLQIVGRRNVDTINEEIDKAAE